MQQLERRLDMQLFDSYVITINAQAKIGTIKGIEHSMELATYSLDSNDIGHLLSIVEHIMNRAAFAQMLAEKQTLQKKLEELDERITTFKDEYVM
jgi:Glu-tRNA(Gln) amidotransferase subunit E-like FAD-binding protein